MVDALRRNGVLDKRSGGLTFALRGIFLYNSIEQIKGLLDQTSSPNVTSTVTIWGTDNLTDYQVYSSLPNITPWVIIRTGFKNL